VNHRLAAVVSAAALISACGAPPGDGALPASGDRLSTEAFASLSERISEPAGFFDTDNLISNEAGYLKVMDALRRSRLTGGAYLGVGPDQNFSYIAELRPEIAFIMDVRRDNLLQHLLLKALIERAPTRVEFLSGLHGRRPPPDPAEWTDRPIGEVMDFIDAASVDAEWVELFEEEIEVRVRGYGLEIGEEDIETVRRFHQAFVSEGPGLRFTSFGRPPRPFYPTYRQLVLETDIEGAQASFLADAARYGVVRDLTLRNRIIPVVGDLAGPSAVGEIGKVMRESGLELTAFYVSNVEFYLWRAGSFERWRSNLARLPSAPNAVVIRSYFPNSGRRHPSALPGYFSTQTLQPVQTLLGGSFTSYWDVVTRGVFELVGRPAAGG
jgi:hypothetical protein